MKRALLQITINPLQYMNLTIRLSNLSILLFTLVCSLNAKSNLKFKAGDGYVTIEDSGYFESFKCTKSSEKEKNLLRYGKNKNPLMTISLWDNKKQFHPQKAQFEYKGGNTNHIKLFYKNDLYTLIEVKEYSSYASLELIESSPNIQKVNWGHVVFKLYNRVGNLLGVARGYNTSIFMGSLNTKTMATGQNIQGGYNLLRAETTDYSRKQVNRGWKGMPVDMPALPGETVIGSKIGIIICKDGDFLSHMEELELNEKLPRTFLKRPLDEGPGVWAKISPLARTGLLRVAISPKNYKDCIELAKLMGVHVLYHPGIFSHLGEPSLKKSTFPNGEEELKFIAKEVAKENIVLGAHNLSNFTNPIASYVTGKPDVRLAKSIPVTLSKPLSANKNDRILHLTNDSLKNLKLWINGTVEEQKKNDRFILIDEEIIRFRRTNIDLDNLTIKKVTRGHFKTKVTAHESGTKLATLIGGSEAYNVVYGNMLMLREQARRFGRFYRENLLVRLSFDGLEGNSYSGYGHSELGFGMNEFVKNFWEEATKYGRFNYHSTSSRVTSYVWHWIGSISWGEPWYADFRNSMMNYRLRRAVELDASYIPYRLGQFTFRKDISLQDATWIMANHTGHKAGVDIYITPDFHKDPVTAPLLKEVNKWNRYRDSGQIKPSEYAILQNPYYEFELTESEYGQFSLKFVQQWKPLEYDDSVVQYIRFNNTVSIENEHCMKFAYKSYFSNRGLKAEFTFTAPSSGISIMANQSDWNTIHHDYKIGDYIVINYDTVQIYNSKNELIDSKLLKKGLVTEAKNEVEIKFTDNNGAGKFIPLNYGCMHPIEVLSQKKVEKL